MTQFVDAFERMPEAPGKYFVITELGKEVVSKHHIDRYKEKYKMIYWLEHDFDKSATSINAIEDKFTRVLAKAMTAKEKKRAALLEIQQANKRRAKSHIGTDVIQSISDGASITKDQFKKMVDFLGVEKAIRMYKRCAKSIK